MSIDADLNAGIITQQEAKKRRKIIERSADFYGAMDGASKFVRGDAIAGIIITIINIIVGLIVGTVQKGMTLSQAAQLYTLLTVGDGLVSQMPAIMISVAAGIVVTRASSKSGLSDEISKQIFLHPKALYISAMLLGSMSLIPGLPTFSFLLLMGIFIFFGRKADKTIKLRDAQVKVDEKNRITSEKKEKEDRIGNLLTLDTLCLEVGVNLVPLVDAEQNGEVLERIVSARKQFAQDLGIIVPMVMVRDNIQLKPRDYQISLRGEVVAKGTLMPDMELAMAPDEGLDTLEGIKTKEPAYGLDALWINASQKEEANFHGYTVVNCATVIVTHLTKIIQEYFTGIKKLRNWEIR